MPFTLFHLYALDSAGVCDRLRHGDSVLAADLYAVLDALTDEEVADDIMDVGRLSRWLPDSYRDALYVRSGAWAAVAERFDVRSPH